jgi:hypothetical protein
MGTYWLAVNYKNKTYFSAPNGYLNKGDFTYMNRDNPFAQMFLMMNINCLTHSEYELEKYSYDGEYLLKCDTPLASYGHPDGCDEFIDVYGIFEDITEKVYAVFQENAYSAKSLEIATLKQELSNYAKKDA